LVARKQTAAHRGRAQVPTSVEFCRTIYTSADSLPQDKRKKDDEEKQKKGRLQIPVGQGKGERKYHNVI
jgi:hypothetical protein